MSDGNPDISTDNITPAVEPVVSTDPNSLFADQLSAIKAPDGRQKFATVDKALEALPHSETHIATQAARIKELEGMVAQSAGIDSVLEQLRSQQAPTEQPSTGIDETQIDALLDRRLTQRDIAAVQSTNATQVLDHLKTIYGDNAEAQYEAKAKSLGMTSGQLGDLARTSPQAALAFFSEVPEAVVNPTTGSVNTIIESPKPQGGAHMDFFTGGQSGTVQSWRKAAVEE